MSGSAPGETTPILASSLLPSVARTPAGKAKPLKVLANLTAEAAAAAVLDAWGMSRADIAKELDVNLSTISIWRRSPVYIEARAAETSKVIADAKNRMHRVRQSAFDLREKMYERLTELLDAVDENGNPNAGIRLEAAKIISADKAALSDFAETVEVNTTVHGAVFHVVDGEIKDGTPTGETIEVAVVEEIDP